jgi:hypothetical protein
LGAGPQSGLWEACLFLSFFLCFLVAMKWTASSAMCCLSHSPKATRPTNSRLSSKSVSQNKPLLFWLTSEICYSNKKLSNTISLLVLDLTYLLKKIKPSIHIGWHSILETGTTGNRDNDSEGFNAHPIFKTR